MARRGRGAIVIEGTGPAQLVLSIDEERTEDVEALALYEDDRFDCDEQRRVGHCKTHATGRVAFGSTSFVTVLVESDWEHEGMYGTQESVALVAIAPKPEVVHTLTQYETDVVDCGSDIKIRRWAAARADDVDLLCIESVEESGVGLFDVMDWEDAGEPYRPLARKRKIDAFEWDVAQRRLVARPGRVKACPAKGYAELVPRPRDDILAARLAVQGEAPVIPCPPALFGGCMVPRCEGRSQPKP